RSRWETFRALLADHGLAPVREVTGGIFVALQLRPATDVAGLVRECAAEGVILEENRYYYPDLKNRPLLRLNFVRNCDERNAAAVRVVAAALRRLASEG